MNISSLHKKHVHFHRVDVLTRHISKLLPQNCIVLDVGSGDGLLSYKLKQKRNDIDCSGLDILIRDNTYIPTRKYDGKMLPNEDDSCDVVMFIDVLHHTNNQLDLLQEAYRVSRQYVIIKDHLLHGHYSKFLLKAMDWMGNAQYGVPLPYNYLSENVWMDYFTKSRLKIVNLKKALGMYPFPFNYIFDRKIQFLCLLEKCKV